MRHAELLKLCSAIGGTTSLEEAAGMLLTGSLTLVGAPMASLVWSRAVPGFFEPGTGMLAGADEGTARSLLDFYHRREYIRDPHNRAIRLSGPGREAVTRRHTVSDSEWYRGDYLEIRRQCGFDDVLTYGRRVANGHLFLSLHRAWGERPFSEEEREMHTLLGSTCGWLLSKLAGDGLLGPATDSLAPRLHGVLACLLRGLPERESAAQLGLSPRTVHKYVEQLYRHFDVRSRVELMALFAPVPTGRLHSPGFFQA